MKKIIKNNKLLIILLVLVIIFFSSSLVIVFDSTHYLTYVNILEKNAPFSSWDVVRGPIFPIIITLNNWLFGRSSLGMLLGMFIFYILYCLITYKIIVEIFKDTKYNKILIFIFCAFCFFNPIVLGYFHTMLTEYIAITLTMTSLYLGWKWKDVKTKSEKILYSLYFIFGLAFAFHLKQPYLCTVFVPMLFSIVYAFLNKNKKMYYISTLIVSIIVLFASILMWNSFLKSKGVDFNTGRSTSDMLSSQLLKAIDGYTIKEIDSYNGINKDKYLTKKEKKEIKKIIKVGNKAYLINIYDNNKLLEKDVIEIESNGPSSTDAVFEITKTFFKYPDVIAGAYAKNYCGLTSVCIISSNDGINYKVTNKLELVKLFENDIIPFKSFRYEEKNFPYPEERNSFVKDYLSPVNQGFISKLITLTIKPTSILYKFVTLLSLLFAIVLVTVRIIKRKVLNNKDLYLISLMLLMFSILTMIANAIVGAMIDRYATVCFMPGLLGITGTILFIIKNTGKNSKKPAKTKKKKSK